jgi:hypothetical protein
MIKHGSNRTVFLVGKYAFKIPNPREFRLFLCGMLANMQERTFWDAYHCQKLCPVVFALPGGFMTVMRRAMPLTKDEFRAFDAEHWKDTPYFVVPVENKLDSFGKLGGRIVAVDYGT